METIDFLFWSGLFALVSPLFISTLKNIGGTWSSGAKQATAVLMALLGSVFAFGISAGWGDISLSDVEGFWKPLTIGVAGIFGTQYAAYMSIWNKTKVLKLVESLGTSQSS